MLDERAMQLSFATLDEAAFGLGVAVRPHDAPPLRSTRARARRRQHETDALASIVDVVHRRRRERCRGHDCCVATHTSPLMAVSNFFRDTTQRPPTRRA